MRLNVVVMSVLEVDMSGGHRGRLYRRLPCFLCCLVEEESGM